jgi:hypothetical protein
MSGLGAARLQFGLFSRRFLPTGGADRGEQGQDGGNDGDANADPEGHDGAVDHGHSAETLVCHADGGQRGRLLWVVGSRLSGRTA